MSTDIQVKHMAVDELPNGLPLLWHVGEGFVLVLMSRQATVDEIAAAMNPMYVAMAESSLTLRAVS